MQRVLLFLLLVYTSPLLAQDKVRATSPLSVSGYMEIYYLYDFNRPSNHTRPPFVYSHNRTGEINLNLGYVKASYTTQQVRANLALMVGTYPNANLASEPGVLKNLYEANIGLKLSKQKNIWLDAGVLSSHIGFESAVGKDCWTLTRSILADNSPYYEAGVRTSYKTPNEKWYLAILLLNGWQRIQRVNGNITPAFGTQVTLTPSEELTVNASTFVGNDYPDSLRRWRYFHNFYTIWKISTQWDLTAGFDIGLEQKHKGSGTLNPWFSPVLLLRYKPVEKWVVTGRWEHYQDKYGVIVPLVNGTPFGVHGVSLNIDHSVTKNLLYRLEGRLLWGGQSFFLLNSVPQRTSTIVATSLCMAFN